MHDIKWIREEPNGLINALVRRGTSPKDAEEQVKDLRDLDEQRRKLIADVQVWQEKRNSLSKEIGAAKSAKDEARAADLMSQVSRLKSDIANAGEKVIGEIEAKLHNRLAAIPNVPLDVVPDGKDEHDNVEIALVGQKIGFPFVPKQHFEIGEGLGQMDFEAAAKLSGARFVVLKNKLARLERAIGQFFIDTHVDEHGYTEVAPPVLVNDAAMFGTAQLPKFREDQFAAVQRLEEEYSYDQARFDLIVSDGSIDDPSHAEILAQLRRVHDAAKRNLWLIPTAEVPLTNLVAQSILAEEELPLRFTALTPCFRAEAGSAGRDTRGMIRQHQFNKVEMVSITTPEQSADEHERMLACAQAVLKKLGLHFRVVTLCTGDMGFASAKTYDIEVWLPGQNAFREISSCSTCTDFQARRMNARYRPAGAKAPRYLHTLNGSGVAVGRAMVAILENYQNEDGSVTVPEVLVPYMGGLTRIERA